MRLRALVILGVGLLAVAASVLSAAPVGRWQGAAAQDKSDPLSGEWSASFTIAGTTIPAAFKFKLDGEQVSGTADSQHTGPGTLSKGSWIDNKLSFTMDFAHHESIAVTGTLKDGQLVGEFRTEGMQGTWVAKKK